MQQPKRKNSAGYRNLLAAAFRCSGPSINTALHPAMYVPLLCLPRLPVLYVCSYPPRDTDPSINALFVDAFNRTFSVGARVCARVVCDPPQAASRPAVFSSAGRAVNHPLSFAAYG